MSFSFSLPFFFPFVFPSLFFLNMSSFPFVFPLCLFLCLFFPRQELDPFCLSLLSFPFLFVFVFIVFLLCFFSLNLLSLFPVVFPFFLCLGLCFFILFFATFRQRCFVSCTAAPEQTANQKNITLHAHLFLQRRASMMFLARKIFLQTTAVQRCQCSKLIVPSFVPSIFFTPRLTIKVDAIALDLLEKARKAKMPVTREVLKAKMAMIAAHSAKRVRQADMREFVAT